MPVSAWSASFSASFTRPAKISSRMRGKWAFASGLCLSRGPPYQRESSFSCSTSRPVLPNTIAPSRPLPTGSASSHCSAGRLYQSLCSMSATPFSFPFSPVAPRILPPFGSGSGMVYTGKGINAKTIKTPPHGKGRWDMPYTTERTRRQILQSFKNVLQAKRFSAITVRDICDDALIHRTTFYRYYEDKYHLLKDFVYHLA